ncbi:MAG: LamG domain-containing protein [Candidatus Poribacteria bacterium]|nr:LamG domain-containing protein [Candidatus Poribacteria bacterium]
MMKLCVFVAILISLSFSFMIIQTEAAIDPETLVGAWLFDEGKGDVAEDLSGSKLDGTLKGAPKWVDGKFGKALELDGSSAYVEIPAHENPRDAITISIWVKSKTDTWNQSGFFVEKRNAYVLHPNQNTKVMAWAMCNNGCWNKPHTWNTNPAGPDDITDWHMYTVTYDSSTGKWFIYIDAKEESTLDLDKVPLDADAGPVYIGWDSCCGGGRFGNAIIDEVAIFNVALEQDDIETLMDKGLAPTVAAVEAEGKMTTAWGKVKTRY